MPAPRKYDVLVNGQCVYTGLLRTAESVYSAVSKAVILTAGDSVPVPAVVLSFHFDPEGGEFLCV